MKRPSIFDVSMASLCGVGWFFYGVTLLVSGHIASGLVAVLFGSSLVTIGESRSSR